MKKLLFPLLMLLCAACSPLVYTLQLDVRQPSLSGIDLSRKTMAIVTTENKDSLFDRVAASAMARVLEQDYYGGEELIGTYRIPAADSLSLEQMRALVMDTNYDVIFVLASSLGDADETEALPLKTRLDVYDSMGEDKIHKFKGSAKISSADDAEKIGSRIATRFISQWKTEGFSLYYFDDLSSNTWEKALSKAYEGEYSKAIDIWSAFAKEGTTAIKRAAACYNIAMAFYLLEDDRMAIRWLDQADSIENLSLSAGLRKRITSRLEK